MKKMIKSKLMQWLDAVPREELELSSRRSDNWYDTVIIARRESNQLRRDIDWLETKLRCEQHKYAKVQHIVNKYVGHGDEYTAHNGEITIKVSCTHSGPLRFSSAHSALTHALNKMTKADDYTCTALVTAKDQAYKETP